jgi:sugar (pentulose or hexulose) kinase
MALFLGFDMSTQSLKTTVSTVAGDVICEKTVNFQRDLPKYRTQNGAIAGPDDGEMTTPLALWVESLDIVMDALKVSWSRSWSSCCSFWCSSGPHAALLPLNPNIDHSRCVATW